MDERLKRSNLASTHCARVEKEKSVKLFLRILPTVFVLISSTAFADITASDMTWDIIGVSATGAQAGLRGVTDFPPRLVAISVFGAGPAGWFGNFSTGESVLGPGTITWDNPFALGIPPDFYGAGEPGKFEVFPTVLDLPFVTLPPPSAADFFFFEVTLPRFVFELDGRITAGPCAGCNFEFRSTPGDLTFTWHYQEGAWHAFGLALNSLPEPGTLPLLVIGIGALGWRKLRAASLARVAQSSRYNFLTVA